MTETATSEATSPVPGPDASVAPANCGRVGWWIAGAVVLAIAARAWVISRVQVAVIVPDEAGSWSIARLLAGVKPTLPMRDVPVYPLFTGTLLVPVVRFFHDPVTSYRVALVLLWGLVVAAAALVYIFVRRVAGRGREAAAAAFALIVLYPATTITSSYTWSEAAVLFALPALLVLTHLAYTRLSPGAVVAAAAVAGATPSVHGRFLLVPALWAVCTAVLLLRAAELPRRRRMGLTVMAVVVVAAVVAAGALASRAIVHRLWTTPAVPSRGLLQVAREPAFWGQFLGQLVGEVWYALASSFGLAALGVIWLVRRLRGWRRERRAVTGTLAVTALACSAIVLTSVTTVAKGLVQLGRVPAGRLDYYVHGRYIDAVIALLAALGLAEVLDPARRRWAGLVLLGAVGALVVTAAVTIAAIPGNLTGYLGPAIGGVYELPFVSAFSLVRWSIIAGIGMLLIVLATRLRRPLGMAIVALLFVLLCWSASARAIQDHHDFARFALFRHVPSPAGERDRVVVAADALVQRRFRLGSFSQEYVLTAKGWTFEFPTARSDQLKDLDDPETGVLVLLRGEPVDLTRWRHAGTWSEVDVWVRR